MGRTGVVQCRNYPWVGRSGVVQSSIYPRVDKCVFSVILVHPVFSWLLSVVIIPRGTVPCLYHTLITLMIVLLGL